MTLGVIAKPSFGPISSPFGDRKLSGEGQTFHDGVDFVGAIGSPIRAVKAGTVVVAAPNGTYNRYGNVVVIKHDDPSEAPYSLYAHMNSISVRQGKHVQQGQLVGTMGNTSADRVDPNHRVQTHLHFELLRYWPAPPDTGRINPAPFFPGAAPSYKPSPYASYYAPSNMTPAYQTPAYASNTPSPYSSAFSGVDDTRNNALLLGAVVGIPAVLWYFSKKRGPRW